MEASIANTLSAGDRALVLNAGHFGRRWTDICRPTASRWWNGGFHGERPWTRRLLPTRFGTIPTFVSCSAHTARRPPESCTTSAPLGRRSRERDALFVVDGDLQRSELIRCPSKPGTSIWPLRASQKGLMLPPGMGFAAVGPAGLASARAMPATEVLLGPATIQDVSGGGPGLPPRFRLRSLPVCRWRCRCFGRRASRGSGNAMPGTRGPCGGPRRRWDCHVSRGGLRTCSPRLSCPKGLTGSRCWNVCGVNSTSLSAAVWANTGAAWCGCPTWGTWTMQDILEGRCGARIRAPEGRMGF